MGLTKTMGRTMDKGERPVFWPVGVVKTTGHSLPGLHVGKMSILVQKNTLTVAIHKRKLSTNV